VHERPRLRLLQRRGVWEGQHPEDAHQRSPSKDQAHPWPEEARSKT